MKLLLIRAGVWLVVPDRRAAAAHFLRSGTDIFVPALPAWAAEQLSIVSAKGVNNKTVDGSMQALFCHGSERGAVFTVTSGYIWPKRRRHSFF